MARTRLGPSKLVRDRGSSSQVRRLNGDIFLIFLGKKEYCVFSLESPHQGDPNENTQYTIFNMNKMNTLNYPKSAAMGFFLRDSRMSSKRSW